MSWIIGIFDRICAFADIVDRAFIQLCRSYNSASTGGIIKIVQRCTFRESMRRIVQREVVALASHLSLASIHPQEHPQNTVLHGSLFAWFVVISVVVDFSFFRSTTLFGIAK